MLFISALLIVLAVNSGARAQDPLPDEIKEVYLAFLRHVNENLIWKNLLSLIALFRIEHTDPIWPPLVEFKVRRAVSCPELSMVEKVNETVWWGFSQYANKGWRMVVNYFPLYRFHVLVLVYRNTCYISCYYRYPFYWIRKLGLAAVGCNQYYYKTIDYMESRCIFWQIKKGKTLKQ
ncbi:hypothetical protein OSTOST_07364 [Ostertagia ostertagi]